jgi:hypothetical protein
VCVEEDEEEVKSGMKDGEWKIFSLRESMLKREREKKRRKEC